VTGKRQKILIVDDKKQNLIALRQVLADVDADMVEATSGNQALVAPPRLRFCGGYPGRDDARDGRLRTGRASERRCQDPTHAHHFPHRGLLRGEAYLQGLRGRRSRLYREAV